MHTSLFIRICAILITCVLLLPIVTGCSVDDGNAAKIKDLDFTVIDPEDAPEKLREAMEEKEDKGFKLTYLSGDSLYIARGFGKKPTTGYQVSVEELYLTKNGVVFNACLYGPRKKDVISQVPTHPRIVVKLRRMEGIVIFH